MNRSYSSNSSRRGRGIAVVAFLLEDRSDILATASPIICRSAIIGSSGSNYCSAGAAIRIRTRIRSTCDQQIGREREISVRVARAALPRIILGMEIEDDGKGGKYNPEMKRPAIIFHDSKEKRLPFMVRERGHKPHLLWDLLFLWILLAVTLSFSPLLSNSLLFIVTLWWVRVTEGELEEQKRSIFTVIC